MKNIELLKNLNCLFVEDDEVLREQTGKVIERFVARVYYAQNGLDGLFAFEQNDIHMVITDIKMPDMNGLELAKEIRNLDRHIPIFIMTAYSNTDELRKAIKLNLVDYLLKPVTYSQLKQALSDSADKLIENGILKLEVTSGVEYCKLSKQLKTQTESFRLQKKEAALLELLLANKGQLVDKNQIEQIVYGEESMSIPALKNLVLKLRQKIGKNNITTVRDMGYMLVD